MTITTLTVFAQNGEKNTTGLVQADGFPSTPKPARQWFNWLFHSLTSKINELVNAQNNQINTVYPVGIVIEFGIDANPNTIWSGTTWVRFAEGQTTVGVLDGDDDFGAVGDTGGDKDYTMTNSNMPLHHHSYQFTGRTGTQFDIGGEAIGSANVPSSANTGDAGQANPDPIPTLMPYVVTAKWRRTA